ncbi:MAG: hypothetical protein ACI8ZB_001130 [Desulforhopalus sp.]|jgi:hypothetical protein
MKSGYESLTWLNDRDGKEYVCTIEAQEGKTSFEQLTEEEKKNCSNVNEIVGTERW